MFQFLAKEVFKVIVFHGSPNYFNKFKDNKIGTSRSYNPVNGYYFSERVAVAFVYVSKYIGNNNENVCFIDKPLQPSTGYLYVCEVPDKSELLDLSIPLSKAPASVSEAVRVICKDRIFHLYYLQERKNNSIAEFIRIYELYCKVEKLYSMVGNIYSGYKGVIYDNTGGITDTPEIIIFNADDIKIKQCFIIDRMSPDISTKTEFLINVLFKRFGEYYFAEGAYSNKDGIVIFKTDEDCPEIVNEIQTLKELENNPFVIAYCLHANPEYIVTEANISSLNYNSRKNTIPEKENIYSVDDIKRAIQNVSIAPVRSKILNLTEFAEYKRQADSYKYMAEYNPFIVNAVACSIYHEKINALFLQRAKKPYFDINYKNPEQFAKEWAKTKELERQPKQEKQESEYKLTDEQIQEKTKEFLKVLKPIIKERIKTLYNLPDETEKQ